MEAGRKVCDEADNDRKDGLTKIEARGKIYQLVSVRDWATEIGRREKESKRETERKRGEK